MTKDQIEFTADLLRQEISENFTWGVERTLHLNDLEKDIMYSRNSLCKDPGWGKKFGVLEEQKGPSD